MRFVPCLFLASLPVLVPAAFAQPAFSIEPVAPGLQTVVLHGSGDTAFNAFVAEHGLSDRANSDPLWPWYVLIENGGEKPIIGVTARYEITGQDDKPMNMVNEHDTINNPTIAELAPHSKMLVAPDGTRMKFQPAQRGTLAGGASVGTAPGWYARQRSIRFSLDSVLFADGTFAGPDFGHSYDIYNAFVTARLTIGAALESMRNVPDDEITQYLKVLSAKRPFDPRDPDYLAREMGRLAGSRLGTLTAEGRDKLFARSDADLAWANGFHLER